VFLQRKLQNQRNCKSDTETVSFGGHIQDDEDERVGSKLKALKKLNSTKALKHIGQNDGTSQDGVY
jgi:hypothetical protein